MWCLHELQTNAALTGVYFSFMFPSSSNGFFFNMSILNIDLTSFQNVVFSVIKKKKNILKRNREIVHFHVCLPIFLVVLFCL